MARIHISKNKDQTHKTKDDNVSGGNVGKKTDHQYKWFCENSHQFNDWHKAQEISATRVRREYLQYVPNNFYLH